MKRSDRHEFASRFGKRGWRLNLLSWTSLFVAMALTISAGANVKSPTLPKASLPDLGLEALMQIEVPVVVGASKFEQRATEAPSSITVISSDEVKKYGYRTLADLLQSVQGFHVSYDRNYSFLGVRGLNLGDFNSRTLLLVDGHRINNNLTDGAYIDTAFILDVDLIDRVEVIRGPGSVLYGNNAFFGVINVVTRKGGQVNGAEFSGEYASFDAYKGRVTLGKSFTNGVELLLSGSLYDSQGQNRLYYPRYDERINPTNPYATNNGYAENADDDDFKSFFGSLSYRDFTLEGGFIRREKGNPTAQYFTTFNDPRLRTVDERSYVALKYTHSFPKVADVAARVYYDQSDFNIGYPAGGTLYTEKDAGRWWGAELQLTRHLWDRHIVTLGAEYRDDFQQERQSTGSPTVERDRQSHGVYAQGDFAVLDNLHFNGGARYDQYGDFDPTFNPRLALIYNPWKEASFKAIYGTAFRVPNFLELALSPPGQLKPEEITSYELVYEQGFSRHWRSSLSGFYNEMDQLIVLNSGGFANFNAHTKGMELALEGYWTNAVRCRLSYTLQKTESASLAFPLPDSPEHLVKLHLSVPLFREKVFAGLEYQYTSSRHTFHTTSSGTTELGRDAGDFGVVNLTLFSQNLVKNLEFSASIYNLLDQRYSDPATRFHQQDLLERDGRSFRLKLVYRF